ncbi:sphingosine kinase 1 [Spea bombifrons]|uniref:sphingosine kinase 1 n=1 Tax=Spea bombifrons TaxID=233779 RepID=UPI002349CF34|nr:sphingosine kinase 1 [Spea bombifrons]
MEPGSGSLKGSSEVLLCDTFTLVGSGDFVVSLLLTRSEFLIQSLSDGPRGPPSTSCFLTDLIGCRSFRGKEKSDIGGYFTVVFYPLIGDSGSALYRQRVSRTFRKAISQDKEENLNIARTWAQKIRQLAEQKGQPSVIPTPPRLLVLLNPHGGTGKALTLFQTHVIPMLTDADARFTLLVTERPNQARELVRDEDLSRWDVIVVMSGDGLMFEVINGLMERPDWTNAIKKNLAILPGGSGNALAASINHYSGHQQVTGTKLLTNCAFVLCKGQPQPLDLVSLTTSSGKRIFSFLSLAWGFVSDVDIESEKYRFLGDLRFSVGTFVRLTALRTYRGRLSYLKANPCLGEKGDIKETKQIINSDNPHLDSVMLQELGDPLLPRLDQPIPNHWTVVPEDQFALVLALYQSHLGADLYTAPMVKNLGEGIIHLFYATSRISRASLLKLFLSMEKGTHVDADIPHLIHVPVHAFRIEPFQNTGIMTVDGEVIPCAPIQGQIHSCLGRVISMPQKT